MTNAEWAIENKPEIFRGFSCPECSNSTDELVCGIEHDKWSESDCANGHMEWLMQPHESASKGDGGSVSVSDECEPAKEESGPVTDADSREKLEADARDLQSKIWDAGSRHDGISISHIIDLLDRQAAITRAEVIESLKERSCPGYEPENHRCRWHDADFELNTTKLIDLKRENARLEKHVRELEEENTAWRDWKMVAEHMQHDRDYWRDLYKQSHAEIAPETHNLVENPQKSPEKGAEIARICRTCRFSAETDPERKMLTHTCYRFPSEMLKAPDDWCGEWSE